MQLLLLSSLFNCNWVDTRWQQYSTHLHTNSTQYRENITYLTIRRKNLGSAGRALSLRVIPWHFRYSWGRSTDKPQSGRSKSAPISRWQQYSAHLHTNSTQKCCSFDNTSPEIIATCYFGTSSAIDTEASTSVKQMYQEATLRTGDGFCKKKKRRTSDASVLTCVTWNRFLGSGIECGLYSVVQCPHAVLPYCSRRTELAKKHVRSETSHVCQSVNKYVSRAR
jgi:hypothetical protein